MFFVVIELSLLFVFYQNSWFQQSLWFLLFVPRCLARCFQLFIQLHVFLNQLFQCFVKFGRMVLILIEGFSQWIPHNLLHLLIYLCLDNNQLLAFVEATNSLLSLALVLQIFILVIMVKIVLIALHKSSLFWLWFSTLCVLTRTSEFPCR